MEKLNKLIERCNGGINISINEHRCSYETVEQYFYDNLPACDGFDDIKPEVYEKMKELDTIIDIQFYPDITASYRIYHYDLEKAVDMALSINEL